jgi:hypothetical protein
MMKIALVHDYLNQYGGGERVLEALYELYPDATVYTSIYNKNLMQSWLKIPSEKIKTNFISKLPFHNSLSKHYFFLYPLAFHFQNLEGADLIISTSSYASKFVRGKASSTHICYLHTVPRFLWGYDTELSRYYRYPVDRFLAPVYSVVVPFFKSWLRVSDFRTAQKIDYLIANSKEVQGRIKKHYKRDADVVYPPVDIERFDKVDGLRNEKPDNY